MATEPSNKFGNYNKGDIDPTTGYPIKYIPYQTSNLCISIDSELNLNWNASEELNFIPDFGEIISQVNLADSIVDRIFSRKKNRIAYKKILAEVLSRALEDSDSKSARNILKEVNSRILQHSQEEIRINYILSAFFSVITVGLLIILSIVFEKDILNFLGNDKNTFTIIIATLLGGIGAFITSFFRFQNYKGSIIAGLFIHRLDGSLRVFYGLIAGMTICLAIKGKVFAGFADTQSTWLIYFFAVVAGASEALIPNLIKQTEKETNFRDSKDLKFKGTELSNELEHETIIPSADMTDAKNHTLNQENKEEILQKESSE
ncbi:MFS transporter [Algoriphagus litoralis]|uniref:hypothetical protein n=1 Tax=Algoriphagus litoralis TaxID=2202829 RepID=UPI000DBACF32|nr:hypothetical protein [Algoriphagus litoralis]